MAIRKHFIVLASAATLLLACDSSGSFIEEDAQEPSAEDTAPATVDVAVPEPDVTPEPEDAGPEACESDEACGPGLVCIKTPNVTHETLVAGTHPDMGQCVNYPDGPYGTDKGSIVSNLSFFDPFKEEWVFLHEYYNDPSVKMILIASGAGWCPPCQAEAKDMVGYFNEHGPAMQVIYGLFEDSGTQTTPPHKFYSTPGDHEQVKAFMAQWRDAFGVNYTLVADPFNYQGPCQSPICNQAGDCTVEEVAPPCDALHSYYKEGGIPFYMIVTTKDMRIRFVDHGYSKMQVEFNILKYVYND